MIIIKSISPLTKWQWCATPVFWNTQYDPSSHANKDGQSACRENYSQPQSHCEIVLAVVLDLFSGRTSLPGDISKDPNRCGSMDEVDFCCVIGPFSPHTIDQEITSLQSPFELLDVVKINLKVMLLVTTLWWREFPRQGTDFKVIWRMLELMENIRP